MNSITNNRPDYELALEATVEALKTIKANGGSSTSLQAVLKAKMFDEEYLDRQHRQSFLKRVNEALGTGFSMNQVRKADPTLLVAATSQATVEAEGLLIPVDELHGEATLDLQVPSPESIARSEEYQLVDNAGSQEWILAKGQQQNATLEPLPANGTVEQEPVAVATTTTEQTSTTSSEHTMNTNTVISGTTGNTNAAAVPFVAEAATAVNTPTPATATNETNAMNNAQSKSPLEVFLADLAIVGYPTPAQRDELYNVFLSENLAFQPQAKSTAMAGPEGLSNDAQFFAFVSKVPEANTAFQAFAKTFKPARQSDEQRSRFSLRGQRDEGVRAGWVAVGGAVLGAALETGHRGSLTVGSGIGAVAGIVGSFFAGELLEDSIDSQFGRYTAAGTLGLAAGALGSGLGRMAQGAVMGNLNQNSEDVPAALPAPIVTGSNTIGHHPALAALFG